MGETLGAITDALDDHPAGPQDVRDVRSGVARPHREDDRAHRHFNDTEKFVVGSDVPVDEWNNSMSLGAYDADAIRKLKEERDGVIYISGSGQLVRALLAEGLVDELHLFVYPIALGEGERFWREGEGPTKLALLAHDVYPNGVVHQSYGPAAGCAYRSRVQQPWVVVVGGANLDIKAHSFRPVEPATSNPGTTTLAPGGVGRNVAEVLARLGTPTALVAAVGPDPFGDRVLEATAEAGVDTSAVRRLAERTGTYTALLDADGELVAAVADMIATEQLAPADIDAAADAISSARLVVLDGNLSASTLARAADVAHAAGVRMVVEPVSAPKARLLAPLFRADRPVFLATPNDDELAALGGLAQLRHRGVECVWVRHGPDGSMFSDGAGSTTIPAVPVAEVLDVTGAGDAMLGGFCHALLAGAEPVEAAAYGHAAAALTVASPHTVRPDLTDALVRSLLP